MQKNNNIKKIMLIEILMFLAWCAVILIFADYDKAGFYFWGGFSFGILSFIIVAISLYLTDIKANRNTTEISYIPVYFTIIYLFFSLVINTYFIFRLSGKFNVVLMSLNGFILVLFTAVRLFTDQYVSRVEYQTSHITEKIRPISAISSQLASILSLTTNSNTKRELHILKETVDYSSNISQKFSEDLQKEFELQLNQIQTMIIENKDQDEINKKIQEATQTWKYRNSVVSSIK